MRKLLSIALVLAGCTALALSFASGCGHYHKRDEITTISSSTNSALPSNTLIVLRQPVGYDQTFLLEEILFELREFNDREEEISVIVEVDNNISINSSVDIDVEGNTIVIHPDETRRSPRLYHWLKKLKKNKCNRNRCSQNPKPCDNEDDKED
jgi:hypothetical protein